MSRKIQVFKNGQQQNPSGAMEYVRVPDFVGTFHQFGSNYEEFDNGAGNYTTLIVERDDGTIFEAVPNMVQFLDKPVGV